MDKASRLFWSYERWILTYLLPIPGFIFVEQILGRGWKSSIRRMWQIAIAFAVVAILAGIYLHKPWAAYMASNVLAVVGLAVILVNLFWRGLSLTREIRILRVGFVVSRYFHCMPIWPTTFSAGTSLRTWSRSAFKRLT